MIEAMIPKNKKPWRVFFDELRAAGGDAWDKIEDPEQFLNGDPRTMIAPDERARIETALVWYDRVIAGDERGGHTAVFAKAARLLLMRSAIGDTSAPDIPWLLAVGFKARNYAGTNLVSPWARPRGGPVCHVEYDSLGGCDGWSIDDTLIPPMDTRAEVRALCEALKIPLNKEPV